ncbi:MAG: cytochrome c maturation protein CcmE [Flavobacteriales bacterium]|nr:cytochrome c maturation protein CcmE [Flavobacteriales bacterium]
MKKTHIIAIIVIAIAIGAILSTVSDSSTYSNFSEAKDNPGKEYHVVGQLNKEAEMTYDPEVNANLFAFSMIDNNGEEQRVHFAGSKPQDFERSEQIVLVGKYENDTFQASKILMKCPSKYNDGQEGELQEFTAESATS